MYPHSLTSVFVRADLHTFRGGNSVSTVFVPFKKRVYFKRKEFAPLLYFQRTKDAPLGRKLFLLKRIRLRRDKMCRRKSRKSRLPCNKGRTFYQVYQLTLNIDIYHSV